MKPKTGKSTTKAATYLPPIRSPSIKDDSDIKSNLNSSYTKSIT